MISVISIFSNQKILEQNLLKSLKNQKCDYELILIDNTANKFDSASKALNYAGNLAKKDYLLFIHQDVQLIGTDWLENCKKIIEKNDTRIYGICGWTKYGRMFNSGIDAEFANPQSSLEKVLTMDEQLIIIPKKIFQKFKFDEDFDDWHCYVADYGLSVKRVGIESFILKIPILHNSPKTNRQMKKLRSEQAKLLKKHQNYKIIFTNGTICKDRLTRLICAISFKMQHTKILNHFGYQSCYFYLKKIYRLNY